jgi:hypothetical protein
LQKAIEIKENKVYVIANSREFYNSKLYQKSLMVWKKFTKHSQRERTLKKTVFKYINETKCKKVWAAWSAVTQVFKKKHAIERNA